jgi:hypothetical protein
MELRLAGIERHLERLLTPPGQAPSGMPTVSRAEFNQMNCAERVEAYRRFIKGQIWFADDWGLPRSHEEVGPTPSREEFERMSAAERVECYYRMLGVEPRNATVR